jgi:hypothetical protein
VKKKNIAWLVIVYFGILACGLLSAGNALQLAKTITPDPQSVFVGEFQTTFPDSHPGSGVTYTSKSGFDDLNIYYKAELEKQGWVISESRDYGTTQRTVMIIANKAGRVCYLHLEEMGTDIKITIKVE